MACPFRFFMRHVLGLAPLAEPDSWLLYAGRGLLVHRALARLHRRRQESGAAGPDDRLLDQLQARLGEVVEEHVGQAGSPALRELWRLEGLRLQRWLARYPDHWSRFLGPWRERAVAPRPHAFEIPFGSQGVPPLQIDRDGVSVRLGGRIDRLDVAEIEDELGYWIIDYKTGSSQHRRGRNDWTHLQLPIYALAVEEVVLKDQPARPLGLAYWMIAGSGCKLTLPARPADWLQDRQHWPKLAPAAPGMDRHPGPRISVKATSPCNCARSSLRDVRLHPGLPHQPEPIRRGEEELVAAAADGGMTTLFSPCERATPSPQSRGFEHRLHIIRKGILPWQWNSNRKRASSPRPRRIRRSSSTWARKRAARWSTRSSRARSTSRRSTARIARFPAGRPARCPSGSCGRRRARARCRSIVYIHGAGWVFGNAHTHDRLVRELAVGAKAAVVFPNYSLSPEAKYPDGDRAELRRRAMGGGQGRRARPGREAARGRRRQRRRQHGDRRHADGQAADGPRHSPAAAVLPGDRRDLRHAVVQASSRPATSCAATRCSGSGTSTRPTRRSGRRSRRRRCGPASSSSRPAAGAGDHRRGRRAPRRGRGVREQAARRPASP